MQLRQVEAEDGGARGTVPAALGLPAAGVTTLALLFHLTTARHRAPAAPQPTPSTPEKAEG